MQEFLDAAMAVAHEAGQLILSGFGAGVTYTYKDDYSPVTLIDEEVNRLVLTRLSQAFPDHSFLGEEGAQLTGSDYMWVFDPIDGTVPYIRGIPTNVFSLALTKDGTPILGVVYDPYLKRLYHASKGEGAYCNDTRLTVATATDLSRTYVELDHHRGLKDLAIYERLRSADVRCLSYSSTVYAQTLVASGQLEGVIFPGKNPWDAAAGKILIEEAGGVTSDLRGVDQRYDQPLAGFVASATPEYHEKLLAVIAPSL